MVFNLDERYICVWKKKLKNMQISIQQGSLNDVQTVTNGIPEFINPHSIEEYQRRFALASHHLILVAYHENQPVGFKVGYQKDLDGSFYSWMGGVLPAYRQNKIAKKLADAMELWAKEQGFTSIIFKTRNSLKPMLMFGLSNGFYIIDFEKREPIEASRILLQKFL